VGFLSQILRPSETKHLLDAYDIEPATAPGTAAMEPYGAKGVEFAPQVIYSVQQGLWPYATAYGELYRKQPAVRACVEWLGRNIAQLNPKVYERVGDVDRLEVGGHPLAQALRKPNPSTTRFRHLRDTVQDLAIYDQAVWVKSRTGGRMSVLRIPPHFFDIDEQGFWVDLRTGVRYRRDQLVVFSGYSPTDDGKGVSPLETLRRVLGEEWAAQTNRENMWRNSARQSGWIQRPIEAPEWTDTARQRFRADIESVMTGGANAGRIGILEEGMVWNGVSFSPKDTEYLAGRRLTYEEVCVEYGLTPSLLGLDTERASLTETRHRQAYQDVLGPWLRMLQDEIELQLLPDLEPFNSRSTVYVEFNLAEKLKGSFEEQGKTLVTSVGVPYMTVNEARSRLNLSRIEEEWADTPVQPLNVMYGGQPAVTVPTDVPEAEGEGAAALIGAGRKRSIQAGPNLTQPPLAAVDLITREQIAHDVTVRARVFFERQERTIVSEWSGQARRDRSTWDDELRADLFIVSDSATRSVGFLTAGLVRGTYNHGRVLNWLTANADRTAKAVNQHTYDRLATAADLDEVRHVFEVARTARSEQMGQTFSTVLLNFARVEAGRHTGRPLTKTWRPTTENSRHAHMAGETVPVEDLFSNGARWPGDPDLNAEQAAGCNCQVEINEAPV
jgi:HK97 family phage portal protein